MPQQSVPLAIDGKGGDDHLMNEEQVAQRWRVSVKTLRNQRVSGSLVPFVRIGRLIRYRLSDVLAYEAAQTRRSTSERGPM